MQHVHSKREGRLMNRLSLLVTASVISGCAVFLSGCPCLGNGVFISDPGLDAAIRRELSQPFGCIAQDDLLKITDLEANGLSIVNLDGLQYCRNLIVLNLAGNNIQSIGELTGLVNLKDLDLSGNQISNIDAIAGLLFLNTLNLDQDPVRNWTPLAANASNGGFPEGGLVIVGSDTIQDDQGNFTASFAEARNALTAAGVAVQITGGTTTPTGTGTGG